MVFKITIPSRGIQLFCTIVLLSFIPLISFSTEIKIRVFNKKNEVLLGVRSNGELVYFESYTVEVEGVSDNNLPHSLSHLSGCGNDTRIIFKLSGFPGEGLYFGTNRRFSTRILPLLFNDPNQYISNEGNLDEIKVGTGRTYRELGYLIVMPTCRELMIYFQTGLRNQKNKSIKYTVETDFNRSSLGRGKWFALMRESNSTMYHFMLHIGKGVFMSKIGQDRIYFHSLESAHVLYGSDLTLVQVTCQSMGEAEMGKRNHHPPPPPPAAGACGIAAH